MAALNDLRFVEMKDNCVLKETWEATQSDVNFENRHLDITRNGGVQVFATEVSKPMVRRLRQRGYK